MNPDKNEDANQIKLGRKCRDDLQTGQESISEFIQLRT
jgi:hypothetical protein